jgi:hypothetical protein
MNPLSDNLNTGTTGELLVQLKLLKYGVQAAPPLKDTGNDLIAVRRNAFNAIQVKTTIEDNDGEIRFDLRPLERMYHLMACVVLVGDGDDLYADYCRIYLAPREFIGGSATISEKRLKDNNWAIGYDLVDKFFPLK